MIAHSQPIALPSAGPGALSAGMGSSTGNPADYAMHDVGSYPASSDGVFNPASFTRHFLGSPISWRGVSSWSMSPSTRFPAGSPTAQLLSSIDLNDYRTGKTPSSIESDSIMNALNVFEREGELCRNYTCCGLHLTDLHALLEHFEEVHIVVLDPQSAQPQAHIQIPFNPTVHPLPNNTNLNNYPSASQNHFSPHHLQSQSAHPQHPLHQQHQPYATPFDPDDMELDIDLDAPPPPPPPSARTSARSSPSSCAPSPPDTPISTPLSAWPSPRSSFALPAAHYNGGHAQYFSQPPSPYGTSTSTAASTRHTSPALSGSASPPSSVNPHAHVPAPQQRPSLNLNLALAPGTAFAPSRASAGPIADAGTAFNAYARFASDYSACMPGAQFNGATVDEASAINANANGNTSASITSDGGIHGMWGQNPHMWGHTQMGGLGIGLGMGVQQEEGGGCVPPALLFASGSPPSKTEEGAAQGKASKGRGKGQGQGGQGRKAQTAPTTPAVAVGANPFTGYNASGPMSTVHPTSGAASAGGQQQQQQQQHLQSALHQTMQQQQQHAQSQQQTGHAQPGALQHAASVSSTPASLARAAASPLLMSKPFRCPKPNCNKSYKQANGLKYHMTHGSCNFAPPKDLEHVKDLLERKRREREREGAASAGGHGHGQGQGGAGLMRSASTGSGVPGAYGAHAAAGAPTAHTTPSTPTAEHHSDGGNGINHNSNNNNPPPTPLSPTSILSLTPADLSNISESDLVEVEREAERRLRPFACGVGECSRRYKNMNGLRYHYQHSGDHGAVGLALLASGVHECLGGKRGGQSSGGGAAQNGGSSGGSAYGVAGLRQGGVKGSASMPVSRAGSMSVAPSRAGTPAPVQQGQTHQQAQQQAQTAFAVQAAAYAHQQQQQQQQQHAQQQAQQQQHAQQSQQQQQQQMYGMGHMGNMNAMGGMGALAGMGLGLGLGASASSANGAGTNLSLKTTALTPTPAPTVHAHAFVVPTSSSSSAANAAANTVATATAASGAAATVTSPGATMHSRTSSHGSLGTTSPGRSRPGSAAGVYQQQQQQGHYVGQQQRYGQQGQQQQQGYALPPNAMLTSPLNPSTLAGSSTAANANGPAPANSNANANPNPSNPSSPNNNAVAGNAHFLDAHGEDALMGSLGMGLGMRMRFDGGASPIKRAGAEGQQDEQDAARAAALYARQQHAAAAAGMGMGMDM